MKIAVPRAAAVLAQSVDFDIYIVGGYVRNALLFGNTDYTDVDICGAATPDELDAALSGKAKLVPVNPRIGTVSVQVSGEKFEYTTFRRDSYPIGGAHTPKSVEFIRELSQDALRRDFTVNALYCNAKTGEIIDTVGGLKDLYSGVIRTVNEWERTFNEDGLRLLRLVRFTAQTGFSVDKRTQEGAISCSSLLKDITFERKREELNKILTADGPQCAKGAVLQGLNLLSRFGYWKYIFPQAVADLSESGDAAAFAAIQRAPAEIRYAVLAYYAAGGDYTVVEKILGQGGLKYSKVAVTRASVMAKYAATGCDDASIRLFVAQNSALSRELGAFARATDLCEAKCLAREIKSEMRAKGIPFCTNCLDLSIAEICAVSPELRKVALGEILRQGIVQNRKLTLAEQQAILKSFVGK